MDVRLRRGCKKQGLQCGPGCRGLSSGNLLTSQDVSSSAVDNEVEVGTSTENESDTESENEANDYLTMDTDSNIDRENEFA